MTLLWEGAVPTASSLKTSNGNVAGAVGDNFGNVDNVPKDVETKIGLSGLAENTEYKVCLAAEDQTGNLGTTVCTSKYVYGVCTACVRSTHV